MWASYGKQQLRRRCGVDGEAPSQALPRAARLTERLSTGMGKSMVRCLTVSREAREGEGVGLMDTPHVAVLGWERQLRQRGVAIPLSIVETSMRAWCRTTRTSDPDSTTMWRLQPVSTMARAVGAGEEGAEERQEAGGAETEAGEEEHRSRRCRLSEDEEFS